MAPVANNESCWMAETFSTGLTISPAPAMTNPHFIMGAQKCTVLGPVGEFKKARNAADDMVG